MPPPPPIGDLFPDGIKHDLAEDNFKIGAVLRFYCLSARKIKRFILLGEKYDKSTIALLYINSELNTNVNYTAQLQAEHLAFAMEGRPFLDNDSFVDCSQFIVRYREEIFRLCANSPSVHIGALSDEDLKLVRNKVKDSKVLSPKRKKEYGCFL